MKINMNQLAIEVCKREGLKEELSIAQIKEVLRVLIDIFSEEDLDAIVIGECDNLIGMFLERVMEVKVKKRNKKKPKRKLPKVNISKGYR